MRAATPPFTGVFTLLLVAAVVAAAVAAARGLGLWRADNASPVETSPATIVAKREETRVRSHSSTGVTTSSTSYFVTFELADGERVELAVPRREFGHLAERDRGQLTRQCTRYKGFVRFS